MSTLLNKSYLVKVSTKGGGGSTMPQILSTWFVHSPQRKWIVSELHSTNRQIYEPMHNFYLIILEILNLARFGTNS